MAVGKWKVGKKKPKKRYSHNNQLTRSGQVEVKAKATNKKPRKQKAKAKLTNLRKKKK